MKRVPMAYVATITAVLLLGVVPLLAYLGVPPFNNTAVFLGVNVASILILLVFGVIGGAFVGMVLAHRILANREFTPFERTVLEGLADVRERLDRLERERVEARETLERARK